MGAVRRRPGVFYILLFLTDQIPKSKIKRSAIRVTRIVFRKSEGVVAGVSRFPKAPELVRAISLNIMEMAAEIIILLSGTLKKFNKTINTIVLTNGSRTDIETILS